MNCPEFFMAQHCAPVLAGVKPANLVSVPGQMCMALLRWCKEWGGGLRAKALCVCKGRILVLFYREELLRQVLTEERASAYLKAAGYPGGMELSRQLRHLSLRMKQEGFPHEIGIFLGYPLEDVIGFTQNKGENCKLCGYWKVYGDEREACRKFQLYTECRKQLCGHVRCGGRLAELFPGKKELPRDVIA